MENIMLFKKKRSWQWLTLWALVFSGVIFAIARFFMHAVTKDSKKKSDKKKNNDRTVKSDELFI
jgi:cell division protein FtsI/penicillin-binding protein 2